MCVCGGGASALYMQLSRFIVQPKRVLQLKQCDEAIPVSRSLVKPKLSSVCLLFAIRQYSSCATTFETKQKTKKKIRTVGTQL